MSTLESRASITVIVAMSVAAVLVFSLLPIISGAAAERFALSPEQIGLVAFYYFLPYALVSAAASFWIYRISWRKVRNLGFLLMVLGLAAATVATSFLWMCLGMVLVAAGAALLFPVCMTASALMENPSRIFAIRLTAEQMVPAVMLVSVTLLLGGVIQFKTLFLLMLAVVAGAALLSLGLPVVSQTHESESAAQAAKVKYGPLIALVLNFAGYAALWAFFERVGAARHFDSGFIALWLSVALLTAGVGPLFAMALEVRVRGNWAGMLATLILVACMVLLAKLESPGVYAVALTIIPMAYGVSLVFLLSAVAASDAQGKTAALMPFGLATGAAVGPLLFGYLWAAEQPVILFAAVSIATGAYWLLFQGSASSYQHTEGRRDV